MVKETDIEFVLSVAKFGGRVIARPDNIEAISAAVSEGYLIKCGGDTRYVLTELGELRLSIPSKK